MASLSTLKIRGLGSSGEGVGSLDGLTVFVDGALPGEEVEAEIILKKRSYAKARLKTIVKASPDRVKPVCPVFGKCGGCQLMHLAYEAQLDVKRQRVIDALQRIAHIDVPVSPCRPSQPLAYRNKIQLPVKNGKMGLYARGSHYVVPIERCYIHCDLGEEVFQTIKPEKAHYVLIRTAVSTGETLLVYVTDGPTPKIHQPLHPSIKGVIHNINPHPTNAVLGKTFKTLWGSPTIEERILDLTFQISAASFFQVNPSQAEALYSRVLELAGNPKTALDAYCGVGTLSCLLAKQAGHVTGIECVPQAISDAQANAKANNLTNTTFVCDAVEKAKLPSVELAILNPPRKGCEQTVLENIDAERILYISCNPATLARDLQTLTKRYKIDTVEPFDMFPQTAHVECLVNLSLNM